MPWPSHVMRIANQSQGDCGLQPRVASSELSWVRKDDRSTRNGLWLGGVQKANRRATTPLGLEDRANASKLLYGTTFRSANGAAPYQPWATPKAGMVRLQR